MVRGRGRPSGVAPLAGNRNLLLLTAGYFTINYFEYIFFYWIYYYFGQIRNLGAQDSAVYTTVLLLSMMVGASRGRRAV